MNQERKAIQIEKKTNVLREMFGSMKSKKSSEQMLQEVRKEFEGKDEILDKILREGTEKARGVAKETMQKVKKAMKIDYFKTS